MAQFNRSGANRSEIMAKDSRGRDSVDYKNSEALRRLMTPNGKIYSRKRLGVSAKDQRMIAQAIKRSRYMALLPFTSATL